jgi:hypothetical protein
MKLFPLFVAAGVIGTGISTPALDAPQGDDDFRWSGTIARGNAIEVHNINGDVRAMATGGSSVEVTAVKRAGDHGDPDEITFDVVEFDGGVKICVVYPNQEGEPCNRHSNKDRDRDSWNDTEVEFTVRVPAGVNTVIGTVNGDVETDALGGNLSAHTVNGDVEVAAAGVVDAHTVNGGIRASVGTGDWDGQLSFHTVNGSIELMLPTDLNADVTASTVSGSFDSDFPLTVQGKWGPKHVMGKIGSGGRQLSLNTVNGGITLRRQ